jgi:ubiquinone/menaquinone biosynthesis C-methylase UbiE
MSQDKLDSLRNTYDKVAEEYTRRIFDELAHKPFDCQLLDRFAESIPMSEPVCDLGCGPGHVARYLHNKGVNVMGIDISQGMIEQAGKLNPGITFQQGNMLALEVADGAWAGIVAFYSIINIARTEVVPALKEMNRALRPGGLLFLAFHIGDEQIHMDEWWGEQVSVDFNFYRPEEMEEYLQEAGFLIEEIIERAPYEEVEYPSRRSYIFARKA